MSLLSRVRRVLEFTRDDEAAPCGWCGTLVAAHHGVRGTGIVFCGEEHANESYEASLW